MDRRQDQVVLVEQRRAGLVAGRVRRIERQLGQEALAGRVAGGDARELREVGAGGRPRRRAAARGAAGTSGCAAATLVGPAAPRAQRAQQVATSARQSCARSGRRRRTRAAPRPDRRPRPSRRAARRACAGPMPGTSCATRKPASRLRGFCAQRSTASTSLTCAASRNLSPPNLTNGMLRRASSSSSAALWCAARNSTACALQREPAFALRQHAVGDPARLRRFVVDRRRAAAARTTARVGPQVLRRSARRPSAITAFDASRIGCVER